MDKDQTSRLDSDVFMTSLSEMTGDEIVQTKVKKANSEIRSLIIRITVIVVCLAVFLYSTSLLINRVSDYSTSGELYDSLSSMWYSGDFSGSNNFGSLEYLPKDFTFAKTADYSASQSVSGEISDPTVTQTDSDLMIWIKSMFSSLKRRNKDTMGWITIENTNIDYPIVYCDDNSYYLSRSFDGAYSKAGTIFVDYRNAKNFDDNYNTVIYGHNLMAGTMFSELDKFFTKSFFNNNRNIYIYTENGMYVYETFCVSKVKVTLDYTKVSFAAPDEFVEFCYAMKKRSVYKTDTQFTGNDRIITLSTCTNSGDASERYCVMAKLVEVRK